MIKGGEMKSVWVVLISVVTTILVLGVAGYFLVYSKLQTEKKDLQSQVDNAQKSLDICNAKTASGSETSTTSSSSKSSEANLAAAKEVVTNFLEAKKTRSLVNAKPYVTATWYSSASQESFAGTSSPSMGRFTITSAAYLSAADLYEVKAKVYQNLNAEEVGYSANTYMVENSSGKFSVNEVREGDWVDTK